MRRTFIVGCPRSGTTVVQAMLARHPDIYTLPETNFFERLLGGAAYRWGDKEAQAPRRRLARRLGLARRYARREFLELQRCIQGDLSPRPHAPWREQTCICRFFGMLDEATQKAGRSMWLEKTPAHLLYLDDIEQHLPEARFVHVIRPGMDVLASLLDANMRYDAGNAFGGDLALWVSRWNRAAEIHRSRIGLPQHHFLFLEDLTRDPAAEWERLCEFLQLESDAKIDDACQQTISYPELEPWKQAALSGQPRPAASKVHDVFGPRLRQWLRLKLTSYESLYAASSSVFDREESFSNSSPRVPKTDPTPASGPGRRQAANG
ncbi:sulfotransferase [Dyella sp.]|uniref:sulfotransferase family protein n=1 Tax=Dyella sp. TaxID=1869338 RepID=UPI002ED16150